MNTFNHHNLKYTVTNARVYLINLDMPSASAGYGTGDTLEAAQLDAMDKARYRDTQAFLSDDGLEVWYNGGTEV